MDGGRTAPRACVAAALVVVGVLLALPCGARAASAPKIIAGPAIDGTPQAGSLLAAKAQWEGDPAPVATWRWLRCVRPTGKCAVIDGATEQTYAVTSADVGFVLRVRLRVANSEGAQEKRSAATAQVIAAPEPTPTPTPTATPTPTPTVAPAAANAPAVPATTAPGFDVSTAPATTPPPVSPAPRMLSPFPIVRVKGVFIPKGVRITLFTVKAPRGVRISVVCRGRTCPVRRFVAPAGVRRLRRFERDLAAGTRLRVDVTKPGFIGKSTVLVIRRSKAPRRLDRCLPPGATRSVRCPA